MLKKIHLILVFATLMLFAFSSDVKASHSAGAEITYEWISGATYKIVYKFYRDCSGIAEPNTVDCCYYASCGGPVYTVVLNKAPAPNGLEVGTGCPGFNSTCSGGSNPGYREWVYTNIVTLPSQCNYWKFYASISARNPSITNLQTAGNYNLYVETTFDNQAAQGNSSPYFTVKPVNYMCVNTPYTFNNGAVDPNGDSLSYEVIQPLTQSGICTNPSGASPVPYNQPGGNPNFFNIINNPISTNNTFTINAATGQMSFTPNTTQIGVITILVREWRNGVQIGTIMRDMQYIVLNCANTPPGLSTDSASLSGVQYVNGQVQGCANEPLSFCYDITSSTANAILVASDNHALIAPGSNVVYTGQGTNAVKGCFSWTPALADTGLNVLAITVKDSTCLPPGIIFQQTFTIPIYVWPPTVTRPDTAICSIDSVQLDVSGGSAFQWSVLPGGSPLTSLSCTNCKSPMATPTTTTTYVVESTGGNNFCNHNKDSVTITVLPPPNFNLGPDVTNCVGDSLQLNINLIPDPNTQYQILWVPNIGLTSDTIANPITYSNSDISYIVLVVPNGIGQCGGRDTINVDVLQGFTPFNHDTAICLGASVQVKAIGDPKYNYLWTPTLAVSDSTILDPLLSPTIVGPHVYTVTASYPGCTDSSWTIGIDVQPVPNVTLGPDMVLCYGDTVHLQPIVSPSTYTLYGYTWNPQGGLNNPYIADPVFSATASANLTLTVKTPAGCLGTDDIQLNVIATDFINLSNDTSICPGDTAQIHVTGATIASLVWQNDNFIDDTTSFDPNVWPVTSTTYVIIARDTNTCLDTNSVRVTVKPEAVISLPDSTRIFPGQSYQIDPGGNCLYFQWFPPLGLTAANIANPIASPTVNTRYYVSAATEFGCVASDSIDVYVSYDSFIDVPNAFSPGSNPNSVAKVVHLGDATLKSFTIYNRWGTKVFESSDINQGWDGKYKGQTQPMGVYVYMVEAISPNGRRFTKQGNITLIR